MKKTIILYYTFQGSSEKKAKELVEANPDYVLCKVEEQKQRTMLKAAVGGCFKAMLRKKSKIQPIAYDLNQYDRIVLFAPIWSGYPAPAFNSMVSLLPKDKEVELFFCSSGGETPKSKEGTISLVRKKGCIVLDYHDIKTNINITTR